MGDGLDFPALEEDREELESLIDENEYGEVAEWYDENIGVEEEILTDDLSEEYPLFEDVKQVHDSYIEGLDTERGRWLHWSWISSFGVAGGLTGREAFYSAFDSGAEYGPDAVELAQENLSGTPEAGALVGSSLASAYLGHKLYKQARKGRRNN